MKKIIYLCPYIPVIGIGLPFLLVWTGEEICLTNLNHFTASGLVQIVSIILIVNIICKCQ